MLQDRPYIPRQTERCPCKSPCTSWYTTGTLLRVWAEDATGAWQAMRGGYLMPEDKRPGVGCSWLGAGVQGPLPNIYMNGQADLAVTPGVGVPGGWQVVIGGIVSPGGGLPGPPFVAIGVQLVGEQFDCRDIFDVVPHIMTPPVSPYAGSYPGSVWFCQWVARRDVWVPPA